MRRAAIVAVGCALVLSACAGINTGPSMSKTGTPGVDTDMVKMATVNQWALDKGATVVWIHYPTKSREPDRPGIDH